MARRKGRSPGARGGGGGGGRIPREPPVAQVDRPSPAGAHGTGSTFRRPRSRPPCPKAGAGLGESEGRRVCSQGPQAQRHCCRYPPASASSRRGGPPDRRTTGSAPPRLPDVEAAHGRPPTSVRAGLVGMPPCARGLRITASRRQARDTPRRGARGRRRARIGTGGHSCWHAPLAASRRGHGSPPALAPLLRARPAKAVRPGRPETKSSAPRRRRRRKSSLDERFRQGRCIHEMRRRSGSPTTDPPPRTYVNWTSPLVPRSKPLRRSTIAKEARTKTGRRPSRWVPDPSFFTRMFHRPSPAAAPGTRPAPVPSAASPTASPPPTRPAGSDTVARGCAGPCVWIFRRPAPRCAP